jgi:membrane-associated phospholipid phosphatase
MQQISVVILRNRIFFIGYFLFLAASVFFLSITSKSDGFMMLNSYHSRFLDLFFMIYTNLGDGVFSMALFLLLLLLRKPLPGWEIVFAFLLAGLMVQVLKNIFPMPRPKTLLQHAGYPYFIDGFTHVGNASFPSGHTATAFATAALLSIFTSNKKWSFLFLFAALLVAYSRIYLGQHFLMDVVGGALIGVLVALAVYRLFDRYPDWIRKLDFKKIKKEDS